MLRAHFFLEWLLRFFHLGLALRVQRQIRRTIQKKNGTQASVFVHMCTYNGVATIEQAVKSMISQSHTDWYLFISDDASTDSTWKLIQELSQEDARIEVTLMSQNLHSSGKAHRNIGLQKFFEGHWDYYTILDQDDVAEKRWLQRCLNLNWEGLMAMRMWNARYDVSLERKLYEYPAAAQLMVSRRGLEGMEYRRGTGVPVDTDFLFRLEFRAIKRFQAIVVAPFLCQKMRFSETNQTANLEPTTIGRWGFFWKYFWSA